MQRERAHDRRMDPGDFIDRARGEKCARESGSAFQEKMVHCEAIGQEVQRRLDRRVPVRVSGHLHERRARRGECSLARWFGIANMKHERGSGRS